MYRRLKIGTAILVIGLFLVSCMGKEELTAPERDCPVEELMLDEIALPPGIIAGEMLSPFPEGTLTSAGRAFYQPETGIAVHTVFRHGSANHALKKMRETWEGLTLSSGWEATETPTELTKLELHADKSEVVCGVLNAIEQRVHMCEFNAQYEEYSVEFSAHIVPSGVMTPKDVRRSVETIDQLMMGCLNSSE